MLTIKQELIKFAEKLIAKKPAIRDFSMSQSPDDYVNWLALACLNSHIYAIVRSCDTLRSIARMPESIDELEVEMILQQLDRYAEE